MDVDSGAEGDVAGGVEVGCEKDDALEVLEFSEENLAFLLVFSKSRKRLTWYILETSST